MDISDFYTRDISNKGIKLPLYAPDGSKTDHWLMIIGVDSEAFQQAKIENSREAVKIAEIKDAKERAKAILDAKCDLVAHLVIDWSFDGECTYKGVRELLFNAPQIMDAIDRVAGDRQLFFSISKES